MTTRPTIPANYVDGYVVTAADYDLAAIQQGNWVQEVLAGTNADKIPASAIAGVVGYYPNILVNGGMEVAQRGTGIINGTVGGAVTVDRWTALITGTSTLAVQQQAAVDVNSQFCISMTYTHAGGGSGQVFQKVENYQEYKSRTVFCTARVLGNSTGCYMQLYDGVTGAQSARTPVSGIVTLSASLAVSGSASQLLVQFIFDASWTGQIDNVMLTMSPVAIDYVQRPPAEEMLLCKRYYQKLTGMSQRWRTSSASEVHSVGVPFPVRMAGTPTTTLTAGSRTNITSGALNNVGADGLEYQLTANLTTTDSFALNETFTLEYNP
jgi:hypothetical protein